MLSWENILRQELTLCANMYKKSIYLKGWKDGSVGKSEYLKTRGQSSEPTFKTECICKASSPTERWAAETAAPGEHS